MLKSIIYSVLCVGSFLQTACAQEKTKAANELVSNTEVQTAMLNPALQVGKYIVEIFEDSKGNLWFGTLGQGLACYDGKKLNYYTERDGLTGNNVVSILEDQTGKIWIGTQTGISVYDGKEFTNFKLKKSEAANRISKLLMDKKGNLWVGTWEGVYRLRAASSGELHENRFLSFLLPNPKVEILPYQTTLNWVSEILEDRNGNIWFGRDGYGACKYDPTTERFTHFTKKDGLLSNNIQSLVEDDDGNIWIGTRIVEKDSPIEKERKGAGGLNRFDGNKMVSFPEICTFSTMDVYTIYKDNSGIIWIGVLNVGVYAYKNEKFTLYNQSDRMDLTKIWGVQSMLQDQKGRFWFGLSGGLFRLNEGVFENCMINGKWD